MRLIQAKVLSTIHRFGKASKPGEADRFAISRFHVPIRQTSRAIFFPARPPSAKMGSMNGNSRLA